MHLCCYLCGLPAWEHSPYISCSHFGVSDFGKRKVVSACGFQMPQAFTTWLHPFSNWRSLLSQISSLVGVSVARLVFQGGEAGITPTPSPLPNLEDQGAILSYPSPADQSSMLNQLGAQGFCLLLLPFRWWSTRKHSLLWPPFTFYNLYFNYFIL